MASSNWAITQISKILPLDEQSLQQLLDYTYTLDKNAAAEHLKGVLGDSPEALDFISAFNARRESPSISKTEPEPSTAPRKARKKKAPLHTLPARKPEDHGNIAGAYQKKGDEDYMASSRKPNKQTPLANTLALSERPDARQLPVPAPIPSISSSKLPPSAAGSLISDLPNVRTHSTSNNSSRTGSPATKTRINVAGGSSMHGASSTIQDLDSAIRALEIQTNPSMSTDPASRRCDCLATRHPLLAAAPNCLNCGKIICVKEGIGPCTFCGHALLTSEDINSMIRSLKEERGKERMDFNNASHRRADVASTPRPFTAAPTDTTDATLARARQHRDKLLNYQNENARRTHIIDEAADFETPTAGQSMWSSPVERAAQLKRQQKVLREQEWNAKPDYEKRRQVISLDVVGGKVVKRMAEVERQADEQAEDVVDDPVLENDVEQHDGASHRGAVFSKNPLMGGLIRPVWKGKGKEGDGEAKADTESRESRMKTGWRRVQDDNDDNEAWILDGGIYGGDPSNRRLGDEERVWLDN
ncbi:MAG: hypothetical protein HETSPECPRED_000955 [Heterodermia speciosa]|uniref:TRIP4/RQT4 C2HC5-type zinc finger domain-containing protein n=1 Tax=Heterodermia speciosa TaxID=116794 RepID=A0A8H3IBP6_9LECA|nr:MAG: hypothetical protein HETSPECPRED_000955 [Heterodermia speciosa]